MEFEQPPSTNGAQNPFADSVPLVLVSNRGPVSYDIDANGRPQATRGSGGLVTALEAVVDGRTVTWISAAMTDGDRQVARQGAPAPCPGVEPRFVVLPKTVYRDYYDVCSNQVLWFVQHYLWNSPEAPSFSTRLAAAWERGYTRANAEFARAAIDALGPAGRGVVMLQDYHLYLAAATIRAQAPHAVLQHFTHIPWPEPRYWQLLPRYMRRTICEGLLANDFVGFQTERDAANFLNTVADNLPRVDVDSTAGTVRRGEHTTRVRVYPVSVDPARLREQAADPEVRAYVQRLLPRPDQRTIVRVDRLDPSKNVLRGFEAYNLLLQRRPNLRGRVRFLAFLVPSRDNLPAYRRYRDRVFARIAAINRRHRLPDWEPIEVFYENNYPQALAGMTLYDVLLVNPIMDGMNLVAKEGPIVNERDGVLVLSEGAGAHAQLGGWALSVAPADLAGIADTLERALAMPRPEREARAMALRAAIERWDSTAWLRAQLDDLAGLRDHRGDSAGLRWRLDRADADDLPVEAAPGQSTGRTALVERPR